jgi:hypothetical protein
MFQQRALWLKDYYEDMLSEPDYGGHVMWYKYFVGECQYKSSQVPLIWNY